MLYNVGVDDSGTNKIHGISCSVRNIFAGSLDDYRNLYDNAPMVQFYY